MNEKIKKMIAEKSVRLEFAAWKDESGKDMHGYLLMKGTDFENYKREVKSGEVELMKYGLFYADEGAKPTKDEKELLKAMLEPVLGSELKMETTVF